MADSDRSVVEARTRACLERELNENAERELRLAVRVAEYERNRWAAFSLVEVEWISSVDAPRLRAGAGAADSLPEQANAELVRRALAGIQLDAGDGE
jgi:hypothetical protein